MDTIFEDPLVGVDPRQLVTPQQAGQTINPNAISIANYRKRYRHVYAKAKYRLPDQIAAQPIHTNYVVFSIKILQDMYCVYKNDGTIDEPETEAQLVLFGLKTQKPKFNNNDNYDVIDIYNHYHAIKMRFMRIFSFEIAAGGGTFGTPPTVDNMWDTRSRHTIVASRDQAPEEIRGRIEGANFYGPFARARVKYRAVPGTIREIIPRR